MLIDDGHLRQEGDRWIPTVDLSDGGDPADDLGAPRRAVGSTGARGTIRDRTGVGDRQGLLARVARGARPAGHRDRARRAPRRARAEGAAAAARPGDARRGPVPVPAHPDPRRGIRVALETDARRAPRTVRGPTSRDARRSVCEEFEEFIGYHLEQAHRYVDGARSDGRARPLTRVQGRRPPRLRGSPRARARRHARQRQPASPGGGTGARRTRSNVPRCWPTSCESFYFASDLELLHREARRAAPARAGRRRPSAGDVGRAAQGGARLPDRPARHDDRRLPRSSARGDRDVRATRGRRTTGGRADRPGRTATGSSVLPTRCCRRPHARCPWRDSASDWRTIPLAASYFGRALVLGTTPFPEARGAARPSDRGPRRRADGAGNLSARDGDSSWRCSNGSTRRATTWRSPAASSRISVNAAGWPPSRGSRGWWRSAEGRLDEAERGVRVSYTFYQRPARHREHRGSGDRPLRRSSARSIASTRPARSRTRSLKGAGVYDLEPQAGWRSVKARVLASRGEHEEAEALARAAVELHPTHGVPRPPDRTRSSTRRGDPRIGPDPDARVALHEAIDGYRRKEEPGGGTPGRGAPRDAGLGRHFDAGFALGAAFALEPPDFFA